MAFDDLTPEQSHFIIQLVEFINTGNYDSEFTAGGTLQGWYVLISGKEGIDGLEIDGFNKTTFLALRDEGYLTLQFQGEHSLLGSPKPKAFREYKKMSSETDQLHTQNAEKENPDSKRKVFVVHGRNSQARDSMFDFLRSLDLHPIEWSEARKLTGKTNPYIGEILDSAFLHVQAIVVLMTPDDVAFLNQPLWKDQEIEHETEPTLQSRANVLFEAGMAMGRSPERTILVEFGKLRPFSDIGGRHTVRINNTSAARHELAQRLADADCKVNTRGNDWLKTGNFSEDIIPRIIPKKDYIEPKPDSEIDKNGTRILITIVDFQKSNENNPNSNDLSNILDLSVARCEYYLDVLIEFGLVKRFNNPMFATTYAINKNGRKYLFDTGMLK